MDRNTAVFVSCTCLSLSYTDVPLNLCGTGMADIATNGISAISSMSKMWLGLDSPTNVTLHISPIPSSLISISRYASVTTISFWLSSRSDIVW